MHFVEMTAEVRVPCAFPVEIVGNFPRDFILVVAINIPVGLLGDGRMRIVKLTCKPCKHFVPCLRPLQRWEN